MFAAFYYKRKGSAIGKANKRRKFIEHAYSRLRKDIIYGNVISFEYRIESIDFSIDANTTVLVSIHSRLLTRSLLLHA